MIRTLDARALGFDAVVRTLERSPEAVAPEIHRAVDEILAAVRARGDAAVLEYTARFDDFRPPSAGGLAIAPGELAEAARALSPAVGAALAYA
ncbi:MAG: histidinol dehydrogenase, partial [Candidatus Rokuibacteriota bacterium]